MSRAYQTLQKKLTPDQFLELKNMIQATIDGPCRKCDYQMRLKNYAKLIQELMVGEGKKKHGD